MKKAIVILSLLSIITMGFSVYEGYLYIQSLNAVNEAETTKSELVKNNIDLENENTKLKEEYEEKSKGLLENNKGCELWASQEEVLKKTKE